MSDISDTISEELDKPIKLRWGLRVIVITALLSGFVTACLVGGTTMMEFSERDKIEQIMTAPTGYNLQRRFYDPAGKTVYGTYWAHCETTITAGHVHAEMDGTPPEGALGKALYIPGAIDAAFYTDGWSCPPPALSLIHI